MEPSTRSATPPVVKTTCIMQEGSHLNETITNRSRTSSTNSNSNCPCHPCFVCDEELTYSQNKMFKKGISPELYANMVCKTFQVISVTHPIIEPTLLGVLSKLSPDRITALINLCQSCRDLMLHLSTILGNKPDEPEKTCKSRSKSIWTEEVATTKNVLIYRLLNASKRVNLFPLPEGRIEPDRPHMYWETGMREMQCVANLDKRGVAEEIKHNGSSILTPFFNPGHELPKNLQQGYLTLNVVGYDYLMAPVPEHISNSDAEVQFVEETSKAVEILPIDKEVYAKLKLQAAATATPSPAPAIVQGPRVRSKNSSTPIIVSYTGAKPSPLSTSSTSGALVSEPKQLTSLPGRPTSTLLVKSNAGVPIKATTLSHTPEKALAMNLGEKVPIRKPNALTVVGADNTLCLKRKRANITESEFTTKSLPVNNVPNANGHGPSVITAKDTLVGSRINQAYRKRRADKFNTKVLGGGGSTSKSAHVEITKSTNLKSYNGVKNVNGIVTPTPIANAESLGSKPSVNGTEPSNMVLVSTAVPTPIKVKNIPSLNTPQIPLAVATFPPEVDSTHISSVRTSSNTVTNGAPAAKQHKMSPTRSPILVPSDLAIDVPVPVDIEPEPEDSPDQITDVEMDYEIDIEYEYPATEYHETNPVEDYFEQGELSSEGNTSANSDLVTAVPLDENGIEDYENSKDQEFEESFTRDPLQDSENEVDGIAEENENGNGYHVCSFCAKNFSTKKGLDGHEWIHRRPYCALCRTFFGSMEEHRKHMSSRHDPSDPIRCFICNEVFRIESTLRVHLRFHKDQNTYSCKVGDCTETFATKLEGIKHQKVCGFTPRFENMLRQKRRSRHPSARIPATVTTAHTSAHPAADDSSSLPEPSPESSSKIQELLSRYTDLVMDEVEPEPAYEEDSNNAYEENGYTIESEPDYGYEEPDVQQYSYCDEEAVMQQDEFEYEESETLPVEEGSEFGRSGHNFTSLTN